MRLAIVDDDPAFCQTIRSYIEEVLPVDEELRCWVFGDGDQLVAQYHERPNPFDLILLDIEMPLLNGLEAAKEIRQFDEDVAIVFLTAYAEYSHPSHFVQPYLFLVKPLEKSDFQQHFLKAYQTSRRRRYQEELTFLIENKSSHYFIPYQEIIYVEAQKHGKIFYTEQKRFQVWCSFEKILPKLQNRGFFQIHRSYIIRLNKVRQIDDRERTVTMSNRDILPVSPRNFSALWEALLEERRISCYPEQIII